MSTRLRVLGQVEAWVDGTPVDLGHDRQRCVLAVLLAEANRVVGVEQVLDRVWADRPPHRARGVVSSYVSRLRRSLAGSGVEIRRRGGGYALLVDLGQVDLHVFRDLVVRARAESDRAKALELLERAVGLWRGAAFACLDTPWLAELREGLERERFAADTDRVDLALRLGRHDALLPELTARAGGRPGAASAARRAAVVHRAHGRAGPAGRRAPRRAARRRGRHRQDLAGGDLGAPARRAVPRRSAVRGPARVQPGQRADATRGGAARVPRRPGGSRPAVCPPTRTPGPRCSAAWWRTSGCWSCWTTPPTPPGSSRCCPAGAAAPCWSPAATGCRAWSPGTAPTSCTLTC
ncbi:DNA-binding SARP family transcriptional activator [Saccharothrix coeruleofusca]|nr:DNA-binding SARP family transcriptional activator [Saccharothrix coeruleofusca]